MPRLSARGIWDYDVRRIDLSDPRVRLWYVQRKVDVGDWRALNRALLREALPKLRLDQYLRGILRRFVREGHDQYRASHLRPRRRPARARS